jgi:hypothetical protein
MESAESVSGFAERSKHAKASSLDFLSRAFRVSRFAFRDKGDKDAQGEKKDTRTRTHTHTHTRTRTHMHTHM